jgi:hypothetical protein
MKKQILLLLAGILVFQLQAQKIKLTDGSLSQLKGQDQFDISFTYAKNLKVGKLSEEKYIEKKMADAEEREPGTGEKWKSMWYEDRTVHFEPMFLELLNANSNDVIFREGISGAQYMMVVNTVFIEPGFNVGVAKKNASIDLEIKIVPVDDQSKVLATIMIYGSPGRSWGYGDYDTGIRVGEAYAKAGKELGKFLVKKKAF